MFDGVRPIIRFASAPTANGRPSLMSTATTDGSLKIMPRPRTYTNVLAVPRSTAMSRPSQKNRLSPMGSDPPRHQRGPTPDAADHPAGAHAPQGYETSTPGT